MLEGLLSKWQEVSVGEDGEHTEPAYTVGGSATMENRTEIPLKQQKLELLYVTPEM